MERRLQLLRSLHCWGEPALLPDASPRWLTAPSAFAVHCPGLRGVHKGDRLPFGGFDKGEKIQIPSGSKPAVNFITCKSRDRKGEVSKSVQMADITISKTPQSLLWCLVCKGWDTVLLWSLRSHYCLLLKQWWVGLTALFKFCSIYICKFTIVLHLCNCLLLLTPMEPQSCQKIYWNIDLKSHNKQASER